MSDPENFDVEERLARLKAWVGLALTFPTADVEKIAAEIERTDAFLPFYDPTGWLKLRKTLPTHAKIVAAFLTFRRSLDEIMREQGVETRDGTARW